MKQELASVYVYFKHRKIRKIIGIVIGVLVASFTGTIGVLTYFKLKDTGTDISNQIIISICFFMVFTTIAVKSYFDLIDLKECENFLNKIAKKMSINKLVKLDFTDFLPNSDDELYNKLLNYYIEGKKASVKLETTDYPNKMNLQFYFSEKENRSISVWFDVDNKRKIEKIWQFIKENIKK